MKSRVSNGLNKILAIILVINILLPNIISNRALFAADEITPEIQANLSKPL